MEHVERLGKDIMDIEFLLWLQGVREAAGPFIESLMNLISHICDGTFIALVPCLLYWVIDKRAGMFVMVNLGIAGNLNQLVKDTACVYRPWVRDARIIPSPEALEHATGYSFPSGHTQTAASVFGSTALSFKRKRWLAVLCITLALLVAFSRNFLGVHTPQDVVAGIVEAVLVIWLSRYLIAWVQRSTTKDTTVLLAGVVFIAAILLFTQFKTYPLNYVDGELLVDPAEMIVDAYSHAGILFGVVAGWFLEHRYVRFSTDCSVKRKLIRLLVCALMMGAFVGLGQLIKLALGKGLVYAVAKGLFPAFIGTFGGPAVSARLERRFDPSDTEIPRESA